MPTRGTQYHLRDLISEMNPNIASIAKLLEELYTRFNNVEQELKSDRERLNWLERETTRMLVIMDLDLKIAHLGIMFNLITMEWT